MRSPGAKKGKKKHKSKTALPGSERAGMETLGSPMGRGRGSPVRPALLPSHSRATPFGEMVRLNGAEQKQLPGGGTDLLMLFLLRQRQGTPKNGVVSRGVTNASQERVWRKGDPRLVNALYSFSFRSKQKCFHENEGFRRTDSASDAQITMGHECKRGPTGKRAGRCRQLSQPQGSSYYTGRGGAEAVCAHARVCTCAHACVRERARAPVPMRMRGHVLAAVREQQDGKNTLNEP